MKSSIRVGTGAGFSDDRIEPAADLAERGQLDYLVFECLAERTIARETLTRLKNPEARLHAVSRRALRGGAAGVPAATTCASSPTWAPPIRSAPRARCGGKRKSLGLGDVPVAVVTGDDVAEIVRAHPRAPAHGKRRAGRIAAAAHGVGERLSRRRRDPRRARDRRAGRDDRPRRRSVAVPRRAAARATAGATTTIRSSRPARSPAT